MDGVVDGDDDDDDDVDCGSPLNAVTNPLRLIMNTNCRRASPPSGTTDDAIMNIIY